MDWRIKILSKIILSRLPFGYSLWQGFGLFRHGAMDAPAYAHSVVTSHFDKLAPNKSDGGFSCLELGPGDSAASVLIARCLGAKSVTLVDSGDFIRRDMSTYVRLAEYLEDRGLSMPVDLDLKSFDGFMNSCNAQYFPNGLNALKSLPDESIDIVWSQAVLEHVREIEFVDSMHELRRILKPSGMCSHRVDLKDHLGGKLNNLLFHRRIWESQFFAKSGFYTNRIRYSSMIRIFEEQGFEVNSVRADRWDKLPTQRHRMVEPYRSMPEDDLLVSGFDVLLKAKMASS